MANRINKLLGEILLEKGVCSREDINHALNIQKEFGGRLGTILLNTGVITEEQLLKALSFQLGLKYVDKIDNYKLAKINKIQFNFLYNCKMLLVKNETENDVLSLITNNPTQIENIAIVRRIIGEDLEVFVSKEENINTLLVSYEEMLETETENSETINFDDEIDRLKEIASEAPIIKLVNNLITKAFELNATDIHFEALSYQVRVRCRVDGILRDLDVIPLKLKLAVIARLKLMSRMNIAENRLPQDGRISTRIGGKKIDIRSSSVPTQFGESFVLRLLGNEDIDYSLNSLGFHTDSIETIRKVVSQPKGIFLTTGPTGSGKTTTLYSILNELNSESVKIITVEDPVEYEFKGVNQVNVRSDIGYTFAKSLRSILRQDPDIIMIGEIRDLETAEIAIQASMTGHLVLSTLHTNNALLSVARLRDMGVEFYKLNASLIGLMAQRLVRKLCPHCSVPQKIDDDVIKGCGLNIISEKYKVELNIREPKGCKRCNGTGYSGRVVISEIVPFTAKVSKSLHDYNKSYVPEDFGFRSIYNDGMLKVANGVTSLEEVLRVTGDAVLQV